MTLEKFTHNYAGYKAVMRSSTMVAHLDRLAEQVRSAAEAELGEDAREVYLLADTTVGSTRAGATVIGVPMRIEAERRILGRAIDAAR